MCQYRHTVYEIGALHTVYTSHICYTIYTYMPHMCRGPISYMSIYCRLVHISDIYKKTYMLIGSFHGCWQQTFLWTTVSCETLEFRTVMKHTSIRFPSAYIYKRWCPNWVPRHLKKTFFSRCISCSSQGTNGFLPRHNHPISSAAIDSWFNFLSFSLPSELFDIYFM